MAQPISILLVEDSLPAQDLIVEIFDADNVADFSIETAVRLADARTFLDSRSPDLIILDLGLPDSDGLDTLLAVLEKADTLPVIVLTGNDDQETGQQAIRLGAHDFWTKGGGAENLLPRISLYAIERYRAQLETEKAGLFLRNTLDALSEYVAIVDRDGSIVQTNKGWKTFISSLPEKERALFASADYRKNCTNRISRDELEYNRINAQIDQVLTGELDSLELEYEFTGATPSIWFQLKITAFNDGNSDYLIFAYHDISARKKAEQARKRSRNLLYSVFDTSPNRVFVKDREGRYVMVNRSMAATYGCTFQEMVGRTDFEIMAAKGMNTEEALKFMGDDRQVLESMQTKIIETEPLTDSKGEMAWYRTIKTPMITPGEGDLLLGIAVDITKELEDQIAIRESENLFRTLLNALHLNIILLDRDLQVIWANDRVLEEEESYHKNLHGLPCRELICSTGDCVNCPCRKALETGRLHTETAKSKFGRTMRMTGCPIVGEDGEVNKVVLISEDISERVSLERQLRQAQKMESLGTLAGGIAHDFNNILTAVIGFTELALLKSGNDQGTKPELDEIMKAGLRAKDLVYQILTFSRKVDQELHPLDISIVVKEALKLLTATLPSSISISCNVPADLGLIIADPTQIHQIVMNLCTNSAHAMKEQSGQIDVELRRVALKENKIGINQELVAGEYLELMIRDTGEGIAKEHLPNIFDPYFTTKEVGEGTGLGLSVVHGIVKDYGGDIHVASIQGEGTSFSLLFPLYKEESVAAREDVVEDEIRGNGERILVVDDEPPILLMCKKIISRHGYNVRTEKDPRKALQLIKDDPEAFDLLLSDIVMPHIRGDKLAKEVRRISDRPAIILMSGNVLSLPRETEQADSTRIVIKPLDMRQLLIMIHKTLKKR